jgi:hypothetical protein
MMGTMTTPPPYEIHPRADGIIRFRLNGYWEWPTMLAFERDLEALFAQLARRGRLLASLVDGRTYATQSARVVERHRINQMRFADHWGSRSAVILPGVLAAMQARRVYSDDECGYFTDEAEAIEFLRGRLQRDRAALQAAGQRRA